MAQAPRISTTQELAELASMARNRAPGLSEVTLRVQTDLLLEVSNPAPDMIAAYEALLGALLPRIDARNAGIVLGKLARWPHLTSGLERIMRAHYSHDLPSAPESDGFGVEIALAADAEPAAEAMETQAEPGLAEPDRDDAVPEDWDGKVDPTLDLIAQARADEALAAELVNSHTLPALTLAPLFAQADLPARTRILSAIRNHISLAPIATPPRATLTEVQQIIALVASDGVEAAIQMAGILDGGEPLAAALVTDRNKTLTTLTATALGFEPEETIRLLLLAGDPVSRSVPRIFSLADLAKHVEPPVAHWLVSSMTGLSLAKPAGGLARTHVPQAAPSGTPSRAGQIAADRPQRKVEWSVHLARPNKAGA